MAEHALPARLHSRGILRLTAQDPAEDVAAFLQGLVTQDTAGPLPAWAGLLSPQGKALFDFVVWRDGADLLIDAEAAALPALTRRLSMYRLRRRIAIAPDPALGVFWSTEPFEGALPDPRLAELGYRAIGPAADDDAPGDEAWTAHRLRCGVPEGLAELGSDATLWLEANAADLNGVCFTKGCYVGQENTARMNWRSKVNRRLVVVPIAQSRPDRQRVALPEHGWAIDHLRVEDITDPPGWMQLSPPA